MLSWLIALGAGVGAAIWQHGWPLPVDPKERLLAGLRALGALLLVALLLDAPVGRHAASRPLVALDASASFGGAGGARWAEARQRALASGGDVVLFGDSLRAGALPQVPGDASTKVGPAVERAAVLGRPLAVITDGMIEDAEALQRLPAGSRVEVLALPAAKDVAVRSLELPLAAAPGDSVELHASLVSGGAALDAVSATATLGDGTSLATAALGAMPAWGEREWRVRFKVPESKDALIVRVAASTAGDAESRNDTLATALDVRGGPTAVFASTAPDEDSRFAMDLMRGAMRLAVRGYLRVAPGQWRMEGTMLPVAEAAVKEALQRAPVAVLHGDTALFGPPRALGRGSLALVVPPVAEDDGEYYADKAGASPLAASLGGVPWDSLPPVSVGPSPAWAGWTALSARRGRRFDERAVVFGEDSPRRLVVMPVRGLWRWRFKGGRQADAFAALWGGVFDFLAQGDLDDRAAHLAVASVREGEPISWRRGVGRDSTASVKVQLEGKGAATDVSLRFVGGATTTTTAALARGVYRVTIGGETSRLVVNPSAEWLPLHPVASMTVPGAAAAGALRTLREWWLVWALLIAVLCVEWYLRRRIGLR